MRSQLNQIRLWVRQGRTDAWIAHKLDVSIDQLARFKREHELDGDGEQPTRPAGSLSVTTPEESDTARGADEEPEEPEDEEPEPEEPEPEEPAAEEQVAGPEAADADQAPGDLEPFARSGGEPRPEDGEPGEDAAEADAAARDEDGRERVQDQDDEQLAAGVQPDQDPSDDDSADEGPRRRRRGRRGGRRRRSRAGAVSFEGTFDHGGEGYGLWLDPAVADSPVYEKHWAGRREVAVTVTADAITIRRAGEPAPDIDEDEDE